MADNPIYRPINPSMVPGQSAQMTLDAKGNLRVAIETDTTSWAYAAAAGGLTTTTAVTIAAATAGERNYLTNLQLSAEALTAPTEIVVRNGANGTVIWRSKLHAPSLSAIGIAFKTPLRSSVNTLLEVALLSSPIAGAVYFNAQGYSAL